MPRRPRQSTNLIAFLAVCVPLLCPSLASSAPNATQPASANVRAFEVGEYQQDLGVSSATAKQRLEAERGGGDVVQGLEDELGNQYAGVWFDNQAGEFVVPVLSEADRGAVSTGPATSKIRRSGYRTATAQYSWAELEAAQERLDNQLDGFLQKGLVRTSLDPRTNAVVIDVAKDLSGKKRAELARLTRSLGVRVQLREDDHERFRARPTSCESLTRYCSDPLRGGQEIGVNGVGWCSAGFRARGNTNGKMYVITAAHCFPELSNHWMSWDENRQRHEIGEVRGSSFPSGGSTAEGDWGMIEATGSWWDTHPWGAGPWPAEVAYWGKGYWDETVIQEDYPINGEANSYVGEYVCHSGASSGTSCDVVTGLNETISYEGFTVKHLTRVGGPNTNGEHCNIVGDSGGPWFASNMAVGINDAGEDHTEYEEHHCINEISWYSEITKATNALNVTIAPITDAPEVETAAATGFPAPHQATVTGWVDPNGVTSNYHFDFGTTTGYGSSSSLYGGGEGYFPIQRSGTLSNVKGNTIYHFRIVAQNTRGSDYGEDATFTTPSWLPQASVQPVSGVGVYGEVAKATLHGTVNPQGSDTHYRFEWGKVSEGFNHSVPVPDADIGSGIANVAVEQTIEGLKGLTEYQYRVVASNEEGNVTSAVQTFTTPDWRPAATTEAANHFEVVEEAGQATLHGTVNPKGFDTHYHFEWGTQAEFEAGEFNHAAPVPDEDVGSGEEAVPVSETIGVKGKTTYHWRLVAENVEGARTSEGPSFTAPDWRPVVAHQAGVAVTSTEADLVARIYSWGFDTAYHVEWGTQQEFEEGEYGHTIEGEDIGSGEEWVEITKHLSGLQPRRAYHFRVIAENSEGSRPPEDVLFKTSTSGFEAPEYSLVNLEGTPTEGEFYESFAGVMLGCTAPSFQATIPEKWGVEVVETSSFGGTFTCYNVLLGAQEWNMNGCGFEFDPGYGSHGSFEGEFDIGPPGCGPITTNMGSCPVSIPSQIGNDASYTNEGTGAGETVRIHLEADDLRYSSSGGPFCSNEPNASDGALNGTWLMQAKSYGEQTGVFVTPAFHVSPEVITEGATDITRTSATLHGTIDAVETESTYGFEYGTGGPGQYGSGAYGGEIPKGTYGPQGKEVTIENLKPGTTYHYRMWGYNENDSSYGEDRTFTTASPEPGEDGLSLQGGAAPGEAVMEAGEYPSEVSGGRFEEEGLEGQITLLETNGYEVTCDAASLDGGTLTAPAIALSLTASYSGCGIGSTEAEVSMDGCHYRVSAGEHESGETYATPAAIVCPEGSAITIDSATCTISIPAQSLEGESEMRNAVVEGEASVVASMRGSGLTYTAENKNCALLGFFKGTHEDGSTESELLLSGFFLEGETPHGEPRLEAEKYAVGLSAEQTEAPNLTLFANGEHSIGCDAAQLSGGELTGAVGELTLSGSYSNCASGATSATVSMNSCAYEVSDLYSYWGDVYSSPAAISCPEGGAIAIEVGGICTITIPGQSLNEEAELTNAAIEGEADVNTTIKGSGLTYTVQGKSCILSGFTQGTYEDGGLELALRLRGAYLG